jgi:hypothetical protein
MDVAIVDGLEPVVKLYQKINKKKLPAPHLVGRTRLNSTRVACVFVRASVLVFDGREGRQK